MIIYNKEEAEKYINDRRFEIFLERLQIERGIYKPYDKTSAEIHLSDRYSNISKTEEGSFDENVLDLKEKTLLRLIEDYPMGISINDIGGMCPIIKSTNEINHITKGN
jgi:hypothetical protein